MRISDWSSGVCSSDLLDYRGKRDVDFGKYWNHVVFPDKGGEMLGYELMRVNIGTVTRGEVGGIEASTVLLDEAGREVRIGDRLIAVDRSEEHTSELQSLMRISYAVFCLKTKNEQHP